MAPSQSILGFTSKNICDFINEVKDMKLILEQFIDSVLESPPRYKQRKSSHPSSTSSTTPCTKSCQTPSIKASKITIENTKATRTRSEGVTTLDDEEIFKEFKIFGPEAKYQE